MTITEYLKPAPKSPATGEDDSCLAKVAIACGNRSSMR